MLRNIKAKIIFAFTILSISIIALFGLLFINRLGYVSQEIANPNIGPDEIKEIVNQEVQNTQKCILIASGVAIIFSFVVAKWVLHPISKIIRRAGKVSNGKSMDIKYLGDGKKKTEIDDLVDAFGLMNNELKENLIDATRQKKQMETILLHMQDGVIAFDIEGNIIHINPAAKVFLNYKEEKNFDEIFSKYDSNLNMEKIIYLEELTSLDQKIVVDDRTMNLFFAPYKNENDRPDGVITVIQDITEHAKLDSMRKEFVANVSHELKTPIQSIMGYSETLLENEVDSKMLKNFLGIINSEAQRMDTMVKDLLELSKYDRTRVKVEKSEFNLYELTQTAINSLQIEIEKKNLKLEFLPPVMKMPLILADKNGIQRVIFNILTNAIKYTDDGGTIRVYVGCVENTAYIKVKDTGIGIPEEDLNKIFERFYRVDKARTRKTGGTGLGLSIAKEILDQNDSLINITSELGVGTEVVIRIPVLPKK